MRNKDFFQILGIDFSFKIDNNLLEDKYKKLQISLHPDKFYTTLEKEIAEKKLLEITTIYNTLKDPCKRAVYILSCKGVEINNYKPEQYFLIQIIDYSNKIESLTSINSVRKMEDEVNMFCVDIISSMEVLDIQIQEGLSLFLQKTVMLKYFTRLHDMLKSKYQLLGV